MKKVVLLFLVFVLISQVSAINVTIFHDEDCSACKNSIKFFNNISDEYNLTLRLKEISKDPMNKIEYENTLLKFNSNRRAVPTIVIDDELVIGFSDKIAFNIKTILNRKLIEEQVQTNEYAITQNKEESDLFVLLFSIIAAAVILLLLLKAIFGSK